MRKRGALNKKVLPVIILLLFLLSLIPTVKADVCPSISKEQFVKEVEQAIKDKKSISEIKDLIKEKDPSILQDKLSKYISLIKSDIYKGIISRDTEALNYAVRERILETQKIKDILEDDPEKAVNQLNRLLNLFPLTQEQYTELIAQYPGESTAQLILKELQEIRLIPLTELNERYTQEIEAKNAEILEK